MWGRTARLREDLAAERSRNAILRGQLEETEKDRDSWKWAATQTVSSHDDLVITRTRERDEARRLLRTAEDDLAAARQRLAGRPAPAVELRDARRALMLSERARASLDEQLSTMQKANEAMCLELAASSATEVPRA